MTSLLRRFIAYIFFVWLFWTKKTLPKEPLSMIFLIVKSFN